MPIVQIAKTHLCECLKRDDFSDEEIDELCFSFGLELDEVTSEREMVAKEQGEEKADSLNLTDDIIYKIEVPANRYDLLCVEGLSQALMIFQELQLPPSYVLVEPPSGHDMQTIVVKKSTEEIRPFVVGAVLRNISFTQASYRSFIDLQDKLHHTICRNRSLVAIGTHDLDSIRGPFSYEARSPNLIKFRPLNATVEYTAEEMMTLYSKDSHLKHYLSIIKDSPVYPVIYDSGGNVLSMPPIINGELSKISLDTKNVFIESTATDLHKASIVLDTIVCMFSQYCANKFTVEPVRIQYPDGSAHHYPKLGSRVERISLSYLTGGVSLPDLSATKVCNLLTRMCLMSKPCPSDASKITVSIPPTRHDILHPCDVLEDLVIAFGYNNLESKLPPTPSIGKQQPINSLSDKLRLELAFAGFTECLTFALCSRRDVSDNLRLKLEDIPAVHISNPKTAEFQVARTSLLPGILKTLHSNKKMPLPLKLFEIQDVVLKNSASSAKNFRQLAAIFYGKVSGFEIIHGLLDRVMQVLSVSPKQYSLVSSDCPTFFPGRSARIKYNDAYVGDLGILHPETLSNFELTLPASALVLSLEEFL